MRSLMRSPAEVEGTQGFLRKPKKYLESLSSTHLEAGFAYHDSRSMTRYTSSRDWRPDFPGTTREAP